MRACMADCSKPSAQGAGVPTHWPNGRARGVQRVSYTHNAIIDALIADPCISQKELAARFGYTAGWVSQILASDVFRARLAERTGQLVDPTIRASVERRFKALVLRSLDILREKLDWPAAQVPDQFVLRSLELSSRVLGRGAGLAQAEVPGNVDNHLDVLSDNLVQLLRRKKADAG